MGPQPLLLSYRLAINSGVGESLSSAVYSLVHTRIKWVVLIASPHRLPWLNPEEYKQNEVNR